MSPLFGETILEQEIAVLVTFSLIAVEHTVALTDDVTNSNTSGTRRCAINRKLFNALTEIFHLRVVVSAVESGIPSEVGGAYGSSIYHEFDTIIADFADIGNHAAITACATGGDDGDIVLRILHIVSHIEAQAVVEEGEVQTDFIFRDAHGLEVGIRITIAVVLSHHVLSVHGVVAQLIEQQVLIGTRTIRC